MENYIRKVGPKNKNQSLVSVPNLLVPKPNVHLVDLVSVLNLLVPKPNGPNEEETVLN